MSCSYDMKQIAMTESSVSWSQAPVPSLDPSSAMSAMGAMGNTKMSNLAAQFGCGGDELLQDLPWQFVLERHREHKYKIQRIIPF